MSVRELVETAPALVTDDWCRQLAGDLLHAVEIQQAMGRPHRLIMPDTVLVHAGGAAELLASLDDNADFHPAAGADMKAIAAVLHFAISGESPPGAALVPRGLAQFSDALLETNDGCLHGERQRRPQSAAAMRSLIGLPADALAPPPSLAEAAETAAANVANVANVADELEQAIASLAAAVGAPAMAPPEVPVAVQPEPEKALRPAVQPTLMPEASGRAARSPRLLLAGLTVGLLAAAACGVYEKGRHDGAEMARARVPVAAAPARVAAAPARIAAPIDTSAASNTEAAVAQASTTYKLSIKPWGEIYVDGVRRGVSPPLKTLTLTGPHTIRIDNPNFPSRQIKVTPGKDRLTRISHDFE